MVLTRNKEYAEDLGTETVSVYVGPERKHYVVHKELLTSQSEYFDEALNGSWKEGQENAIHLEEDEPAAVALLIAWLYRGSIPGTDGIPGPFVRSPPSSNSPSVSYFRPGTGAIRFAATISTDPTPSGTPNQDVYQHLGCQPAYLGFCPEELRLADYQSKRRYSPSTSSSLTPNTSAPQPQSLMNIPSSLGGWIQVGQFPQSTGSGPSSQSQSNTRPTSSVLPPPLSSRGIASPFASSLATAGPSPPHVPNFTYPGATSSASQTVSSASIPQITSSQNLPPPSPFSHLQPPSGQSIFSSNRPNPSPTTSTSPSLFSNPTSFQAQPQTSHNPSSSSSTTFVDHDTSLSKCPEIERNAANAFGEG